MLTTGTAVSILFGMQETIHLLALGFRLHFVKITHLKKKQCQQMLIPFLEASFQFSDAMTVQNT